MTFSEKLRELAGKATPGPWLNGSRATIACDESENCPASTVCTFGINKYWNLPNKRLVLHLVNHASAIAAVVESSERVADFGTMRREEFVEKWKCVATAAYVFDQLTTALTALNRTGGDDERG